MVTANSNTHCLFSFSVQNIPANPPQFSPRYGALTEDYRRLSGDIDDGRFLTPGTPPAIDNQIYFIPQLCIDLSGRQRTRPATQVGAGTHNRCSQALD